MKQLLKRSTSAIIFIISVVFGIVLFYELNLSRLNSRIENSKNNFALITNLTADTISYGYFQWDDMYYAAMNNETEIVQDFFEEISELSSYVKRIQLVKTAFDSTEDYFTIESTHEKLYINFKILDGTSENALSGKYARIEMDIHRILSDIQSSEDIYFSNTEKGKHSIYNLQIQSHSPPILFFQIISSIFIGIFTTLIFNRVISRHNHFFYETRGLEKVIYLFERTEKYSADHSKRVAHISTFIGRKYGIRGRKLKDLKVASLLHDIGKISVPVEILNKERKLSEDEFGIVKNHVIYSAEIIENFEELAHLKKIILHHHEKMDGSGYPSGLKGEEIPLESRIIAIADIYEALIGRRPYRDSISPSEAMLLMKRMKLDENLLNVLEENLDQISAKL